MGDSGTLDEPGEPQAEGGSKLLLLGIVLGVILGALVGGLWPGFGVEIEFLGQLFLNALMLMVIPLVICSMVMGIAAFGDVRKLGSIGLQTVVFYMLTTALAVFVGLIAVNLVEPGEGVNMEASAAEAGAEPERAALERTRAQLEDQGVFEVVREVVLRLVPDNLIAAAAETEVLPVILFSLALGAVLTTLGERGRHVIRVFDGLNEAIMVMVQGIMYFAPVGIFALVAGRLGEAGGFAGFLPQLKQIAWYALTVLGALGVHALIVLPALLLFVARKNPITYARAMFAALLTAFSTASSAATLPVTLRGVTRSGVSERAASFVCPLGATINMDGTAMYEAVAAMFIAQAYGIELGVVHQIVIFLTATLAAIGAAGIPEAGLVTMVIVLNAVNLPTDGIVLILAIDWLLDRCRTTINVWGDSIGAAVIDQLQGRPELELDPPEGAGA